MTLNQPIKNQLADIPKKPGVYVFKGGKSKVLYVGKAKNLKNRVRSYFQKGASLDYRKSSMVAHIEDISYIVTGNELEALALEANLIKQYKPRYNIILRDDKNYPYLKLTVNEEWPRLEVVRRIKKDGALYFGPYVPTGSMWEALAIIRRHFNIRPCKYSLDKPMRPCIQHEMGRCPAPCAGYLSKEDYMKAIDEVINFLRGRKKELMAELERRMQRLSGEQRYEEAAVLRDRIKALQRAWESQKVIAPELGDIDVVGFASEGDRAECAERGCASAVQVFFVRNGVMIGAKGFHLKESGAIPAKELLYGFLEMFYSKELIPPPEIVVSVRPEGAEHLISWLEAKRGGRLKITVPRRGKKLELLRMAGENAKILLERGKGSGADATLEELKTKLSLTSAPRTIGAFDVSTIAGTEPVGAFVYWADGDFKKDLYRHVKIRTVAGIDDYAMMRETVTRVLEDIKDNWPDMIIIDGGRGHLEAALGTVGASIGAFGPFKGGVRPPVFIGVAKKPDRAITLDSEISLDDTSPSSLLLRRIRDEVHRFAISFHKKLRGKGMMKSPLDDIPGVAKKRRLALLRHFGDLDAIRRADVEEIAKVPGMNRKVAEKIKEAL